VAKRLNEDVDEKELENENEDKDEDEDDKALDNQILLSTMRRQPHRQPGAFVRPVSNIRHRTTNYNTFAPILGQVESKLAEIRKLLRDVKNARKLRYHKHDGKKKFTSTQIFGR